jgi:multisubunit Na+/H+ antiporter MnhC subunit
MMKKMVGIRIAKAAAFLFIVKAVLKRQSSKPKPTREKIKPDR